MSKKNDRRNHRRLRKRMGRSFCMVYGLAGPDGKVRYIGQTRQTPSDRLDWYYRGINNPRKRTSPVQRWFEHILRLGHEPQLIVIDSNATWDVSEIIYIERYRASCHELLNVTRGGLDGVGNIRREERGKRRMP